MAWLQWPFKHRCFECRIRREPTFEFLRGFWVCRFCAEAHRYYDFCPSVGTWLNELDGASAREPQNGGWR